MSPILKKLKIKPPSPEPPKKTLNPSNPQTLNPKNPEPSNPKPETSIPRTPKMPFRREAVGTRAVGTRRPSELLGFRVWVFFYITSFPSARRYPEYHRGLGFRKFRGLEP